MGNIDINFEFPGMTTYLINPRLQKVPGYYGIVKDLLDNYYSEISENELSVDARIVSLRKDFRIISYGGKKSSSNKKYFIEALIPEIILVEQMSDLVLKAGFAHELAHIVRGDCSGLRGSLLNKLREISLFERKITSWIEKGADKEVIRRGLEKEGDSALKYLAEIGVLNS